MRPLERLGETYPELAPVLERGVAGDIDGRLCRNALLQPIPAGAEVFLMPAWPEGEGRDGVSFDPPRIFRVLG